MWLLYIILMCISCFMFIANELFAIYFICTLVYRKMEIMLNKKQIRGIFLIWVQNRSQNSGDNHNINTFGQETANEHTMQWWFNKFCKGDKSLEDEHSGQPLEADNNREDHQSYYTRRPKNSMSTFYGHVAFEANWKGEKTW